MSVGPYRTWFMKWVPTLKTQNYRFTCSSSGMIQMIPRSPRRIEGPIAVPRPPSEEPIEETQAEIEPDIDELRAQLGAELKRLLAEQNRPTAEPEPEIKAATQKLAVVQEATDDDAVATDPGEVVVIQVPVKLRVTSEPRIRIEVVE